MYLYILGERLIVTAPRAQAQQYVVTVPPNVKPGIDDLYGRSVLMCTTIV